MNLRNRQLPQPINNRIRKNNLFRSENIYNLLEEKYLEQKMEENNIHQLEDEQKQLGINNNVNNNINQNLGGSTVTALVEALNSINPKGVMPTYSGSDKDPLPEIYIKKWNIYGRINSMTDTTKLGYAGIFLKGDAETWYNNLDEDVPAKHDWKQFELALIKRFTTPNSDANNYKIFTQLKQKKNQSVEEFGEELKRLVNRIRNKQLVPELTQVTTFVNNLLPDLKYKIDCQDGLPADCSLEAVIMIAKRLEIATLNYNAEVKSQSRYTNSTKPEQYPVVAAQVISPGTFSSGSNRPQRDMSKVICNRCNEPGHYSNSEKCPGLQSITCFNCQEKGHFASQCKREKVTVKQERKDPVRVVSAVAENINDGNLNNNAASGFVVQRGDFITTAVIGDVRTPAVVDSGAAKHCISATFYNRMDKQLHPLTPADLTISNANGKPLHVIGCVDLDVEFDNGKISNKLNINRTSNVWKFYVVEGLTDNVLVGRDDIESVTLKNGMMVEKQRNLVRIAEAVTVPGHCVKMIKTVSDKATDGQQILEPHVGRNGNIQIARCVVNDGVQHHITNIINTGVNPIHLPADQIVGRIEDVIIIPANSNEDAAENSLGSGTGVDVAEVSDSTVRQININSNADVANNIANQLDSRLIPIQSESLLALLQRYIHVFSSNPKGPGMVTHVEHTIDTGTSAPIKQRSYRVSRTEEEHINNEVDEMLTNDIIRPSCSPWSSPVVLVSKKDGSMRFCIDYRKLNDVTKKDSYPLPRIQEALDVLNGAKYFSSLDFAAGYWQIKVRDEDIPKTAFVTKRGLFEFTRMPFGLVNAPATFQRAMDVLLTGLNWKVSLIYIDDILVFSPTFDQHLVDLESVLQRLSVAKFTVKLSKCFFGREEVAYLGHLVGSQGVKPDPSKLNAVKLFPVPTNLTEVRSFLGLTTYYHRFVPCYSSVAEPLYRLQKKNVHFEWSSECQIAFERIKQLLVSSPTLRFPNFEREFILMTDASGVGVGVILSQIDENDKEYVVGYASRALSSEERNYSTTEKECLAVLYGIKYFRCYLHGNHFTVITDHGSLTWLINLRDANGRLARWALQLQGFHYTIKHRPGREHANADALSRCPIRSIYEFTPIRVITRARAKQQQVINVADSTNVQSNNENIMNQNENDIIQLQVANDAAIASSMNDDVHQNAFEDEQIANEPVGTPVSINSTVENFRSSQLEDVEYANIINYLKHKQLPEDVKEASRIRVWSSNFMLTDDLLYYIWTPSNMNQRLDVRKQLVVPSKLRQSIMIHNHDSYVGGHFGSYKTFMKIRDRYWWPTMFQDVELFCKSCLICQLRKVPRRQREAALMGTPVANYPFERIGVDVVGPLPKSLAGNKYIVVFTDSFTRWTEAFAVVEQKEETIKRSSTNLSRRHPLTFARIIFFDRTILILN